MIIDVTVRMETSWCDDDLGEPVAGDPLEQRIVDAVEEAVAEAVRFRAGDGYHHDLENILSLELLACDARRVPGFAPRQP